MGFFRYFQAVQPLLHAAQRYIIISRKGKWITADKKSEKSSVDLDAARIHTKIDEHSIKK